MNSGLLSVKASGINLQGRIQCMISEYIRRTRNISGKLENISGFLCSGISFSGNCFILQLLSHFGQQEPQFVNILQPNTMKQHVGPSANLSGNTNLAAYLVPKARKLSGHPPNEGATGTHIHSTAYLICCLAYQLQTAYTISSRLKWEK